MSMKLFPKGTLLSRKQGAGSPFKPVDAEEALSQVQYVMLYFSAHWCPPCRMFTPQLKSFYETHHKTKSLEVVFVSMDNTENEMNDYFKNAHGDWLSLTYTDAKQVSQSLSRTFGLYSIPSLLLFKTVRTPAGETEFSIITTNARSMVPIDPAAESFPWENADALIKEQQKATMRKVLLGGVIAVGLFVVYKMLN
ncbi:tryparedoxin-like protein [Angomonas deanei]|uniref:Redoxin/AhpC/TSA family/Thioredoxin/Thioredoxin-like, putative n=1 Tax=Angomonas deanei TaxID=59799 RepID=S9VU26_9TRYP|nr:tryparedoxin-like protein [Angomonas deanei]EPY38602.1 tryparedoxin-like protein [Angomonas deanei]EPY39689.1 tryparedoxin-like protein [Angomonas deanei]CAD2213682.1 Redoxin/AhpC/TSA family/Thioredoxin/Thioredoxin-like, putative [Angomonas deanei]|eukprot:EPY30626.1 tryparedoxin-like protein [Angomonas deanei]